MHTFFMHQMNKLKTWATSTNIKFGGDVKYNPKLHWEVDAITRSYWRELYLSFCFSWSRPVLMPQRFAKIESSSV